MMRKIMLLSGQNKECKFSCYDKDSDKSISLISNIAYKLCARFFTLEITIAISLLFICKLISFV